MRSYKTFGLTITVLALAGASAFWTRDLWIPLLMAPSPETAEDSAPAPAAEPKMLKLSPQARKNLGLVARPLTPRTYERTIQVPGVIVDRPGHSDRGVTAPAVGVVAKVHAFPGDLVKPGDRLFTLRLVSEYLQNIQSELFKTAREMELVKEQHDRLEGLAPRSCGSTAANRSSNSRWATKYGRGPSSIPTDRWS